MRSVELFAGAGGLALGTAQAGFHHEAVAEWDQDACDTIRENQRRGLKLVCRWPLFQGDVRQLDYSGIPEGLDLVAGGPPCQPFSLGGKHRSIADERNMFPEIARAMRELKPRAVIVENVKGLLRSSFAKHFEYILFQLAYPELVGRKNEDWTSHLSRLEEYQTAGRRDGLYYQLVFRLLDAADYGIPQRRHRVIIVGFRSDLKMDWSFPTPTHSHDALLRSQWVTGEYWERHKVVGKHRPKMPACLAARVDHIRGALFQAPEEPWRTVRDAIAGLPDPETLQATNVPNHRLQPGARPYVGHTGSPLDLPAKALKAGDHGVPGGENMVANPDGRVRYFTVRESARLQTFPDDYVFRGSWTESMRQLGNAVPVALARIVADSVRARLER
jgi:DNA (cytosine-5)-methyltransferase 1